MGGMDSYTLFGDGEALGTISYNGVKDKIDIELTAKGKDFKVGDKKLTDIIGVSSSSDGSEALQAGVFASIVEAVNAVVRAGDNIAQLQNSVDTKQSIQESLAQEQALSQSMGMKGGMSLVG